VLIAPHAWWAWTILAASLIARIAVALRIGEGVLRDPQVKHDLWLIPLRDFLALATWAWSYAGDTVTWRGEKFRLKDGRMYRSTSSS
jgi:ceramide glucosyltransferase